MLDPKLDVEADRTGFAPGRSRPLSTLAQPIPQEMRMHSNQSPVHYAPSSVGGLMDPAFLRGAALDAGDEHILAPRSPSSMLRLSRVALTRLWRRAFGPRHRA
jgi:hypothetical protein